MGAGEKGRGNIFLTIIMDKITTGRGFPCIALGGAAAAGLALGACLMGAWKGKELRRLRGRAGALTDHFQLLNHWLEIKNEGKSTASYFTEMGYGHIAIYGMAELANRLIDDLAGGPVVVDYGIDRDISCSAARISEVYSPDDELPETDAVVVTPYADFDEIKGKLEGKVACPAISLEEVVWSI